MKYYVFCKEHAQEKIYIDFSNITIKIAVKNDIPYHYFTLFCHSNNHINVYDVNEIQAERGFVLGGALIGGLLFIIDPILGFIDLIKGLIGISKKEQEKVKKFNNSIYH